MTNIIFLSLPTVWIDYDSEPTDSQKAMRRAFKFAQSLGKEFEPAIIACDGSPDFLPAAITRIGYDDAVWLKRRISPSAITVLQRLLDEGVLSTKVLRYHYEKAARIIRVLKAYQLVSPMTRKGHCYLKISERGIAFLAAVKDIPPEKEWQKKIRRMRAMTQPLDKRYIPKLQYKR